MQGTTLEEITKTAVQTALEYMDREKLKRRKANHDNRLRNIKLLLRHYRAFVDHAERLEEQLTPQLEVLELNALYEGQFEVKAIKASKMRTMIMIRFIRQALELYRLRCESYGPDEVKRYQTVFMLYISDDILSTEQIAERQGVDTRTVYKHVDYVCKALSVLVFGIDAVQFD